MFDAMGMERLGPQLKWFFVKLLNTNELSSQDFKLMMNLFQNFLTDLSITTSFMSTLGDHFWLQMKNFDPGLINKAKISGINQGHRLLLEPFS